MANNFPRASPPSITFVSGGVVEQVTYELCASKDGRTHTAVRPNIMPSLSNDDVIRSMPLPVVHTGGPVLIPRDSRH